MVSRVSGAFGGITSQLTRATVFALLILDAMARSNGQRWLRSVLMPTIKMRENDWSREALSAHALLTAAWLGEAASHPALRTTESRQESSTRGSLLIDGVG